VPLSRFVVVQEHFGQPNAVVVTCFDGVQTLLVFISCEAIDNYFRRQDLTERQCNLLVTGNLDQLVPVISGKYERGEVSTYAFQTGRPYARIDLTAADLEQAPEKLTDSVLDIDARAGFQGVLSGPPQTSFTPVVAGVAHGGFYDASGYLAQPGSRNTPLPLRAEGSGRTPPLEPIPPQSAGPQFTISAEGQIVLAPPPELDTSGNDITRIRQFLPLVRRAADDLAAVLNPNQFPLLSRNLGEYRTAIALDVPEIAWGIVFGLGVRLVNAADAAQRRIEDRLLSALEDPAQEALQSLRILHGSLIMATAEGRELEEQSDRLQMTREQQAALRADAVGIAAELHRAAEVIEPQADKIVTEAAEVIGEGPRSERGTVYGIATFTHLTIVLISAATLTALVPIGVALGGTVGGVAGGGAAWIGFKGLEKSNSYKVVTTALGALFNRLHELDEGAARQRLAQLAPFRQFVIRNEQPLRRIATNTRRMRWMLSYIDFIVPQSLEIGQQAEESAAVAAMTTFEQLDKLPARGVVASQIGDRVLALWKSDDYWYSGTVADVSEGRLLIKFEDGYHKWLALEHVKLLGYHVDDYVECRWKGLPEYYPTYIIEIRGDIITVQYRTDFSPDGPSLGEKEQTNIKLIRFTK
jgi:hypothetical protein